MVFLWKLPESAGFRLKNTQTQNDDSAIAVYSADSHGSEQVPAAALSGPCFSMPQAWPEVSDLGIQELGD
jgi:hypothetical protein